MRAVAFSTLALGAQAFVVPTMTVKSEVSTRRDFAKVLAAGVIGAAAPALAVGGSPKQNLFGVIGTAPMVGGGGMSSPYSEIDTYSPYSPYSATEDGTAVFKGVTDDMTKRYISIVKECSKIFEKIPGWVEGRKWMEVRSVLTNYAYELRGAMNALASSKPAAAAAAKEYYKDLEVVIVAARNKDAGSASSAYAKSKEDLAKYLSSL